MLRKLITFGLVVLVSGGSGYYLATIRSSTDQKVGHFVQSLREGQQGLINPLLEYEIGKEIFSDELKPFDNDLRTLVASLVNRGRADRISVYFRSLNNGPWFGISEDANFFPASLLKVPILVTYLRLAEVDTNLLNKKITYDSQFQKLGDFNQDQNFKSEKTIQPNQTYTVWELLEYMIRYSDNNAKNILVLNLNSPNDLYQTYLDLGMVTPPELRGGGDIISTHEYATFYRVLYNASYLSKDMSQKALQLLAQTDFNKGISDPVPDNITIAHKFGEYSGGTFKQLHDCGIIYHPRNPYILCVMTRGTNFSDLEEAIKEISKQTYAEVDKGQGLITQ